MKIATGVMRAAAAAVLFIAMSAVAFAAEEAAPAAAESTSQAGPQADIPAVVPDFDFKDVYGRVVKAEDLKNWIVVYGFGNEKNAETAIGWLEELTFSNPNAEGILYVSVADASKYQKIMYPFVKKVAKEEYKKKIGSIKRKFVERGIECKFVPEDRYMLTLDTKADIFELFGIDGHKNVPHIFIVDGNRNVLAHFTEYTEAVPAALSKALAARETAANLVMKTHARKKNVFKRWGLIGAGVLLLSLAF